MTLFTTALVLHIISVMVAVGTVTVTDYLHILGLRDPTLERHTIPIFSHLSNLIRISLLFIYSTGAVMVYLDPSILSSEMFWIKMALVIVVTINGFFLHHLVFPRIEEGVKKKQYSTSLIRQAAIYGSLSVVAWYSIVVLAISKDAGYGPITFLFAFLLTWVLAYIVAQHIETKQRKKHHKRVKNHP